MIKPRRHPDARLWAKLHTAAREMRNHPTAAEDLLWQRLRNRQLCGYKFHHQYPIDRFIVDFCCIEAALVIEVDGEIHQQQIVADGERDQILSVAGFHMLHFTNQQVMNETEQVLQQIIAALEGVWA